MANLQLTYEDLKMSRLLNEGERFWIEKKLSMYPGGEISVKQMWRLLDDVWKQFECDPAIIDERTSNFYSHPVWLLNGIHIETDTLSRSNRIKICEWIIKKKFKRIADFGGGFGGLARLIGENYEDCEVEVIDPYSNEIGKHLASKYEHINYCKKLTGRYDLIIATDVFEHVIDPLGLVEETSQFLEGAGYYLIGNCFEPVILCHLPCTFHFGASWDVVLKHLGMEPQEQILYTRAFRANKMLNLQKARLTESKSRKLYPYIKFLPRKIQRILVSKILDI